MSTINNDVPVNIPSTIPREDDLDDFEMIEDIGIPDIRQAPTLRNAKTVKTVQDDAMLSRLENLKVPRHRDSIAAVFGRFIMKAVYGITHLFSKQPAVPDRNDKPMTFASIKHAATPVRYDEEVIGQALGVKNGKVKAFNQPIYPCGTPSLTDIRQNPAIQECWYLAAIGALLNAQGPQSIHEMIKEDERCFTVTLGECTYAVPKGDIVGRDGKIAVSNSAPWVRLLEYALQAQLINQNGDKSSLSDIFIGRQPAGAGLKMLLGTAAFDVVKLEGTQQKKIANLALAVHNGNPIVMGHMPRFGMGVFTDGISHGHAVTVLDIMADESNSRAKITVLDPYGVVRVLDEGVLSRSELYVAEPKPH